MIRVSSIPSVTRACTSGESAGALGFDDESVAVDIGSDDRGDARSLSRPVREKSEGRFGPKERFGWIGRASRAL